AAGLVALDTMLDWLAHDHDNARRLATGLSQIAGVSCSPEKTVTNIVMFDLPPHIPTNEFIQRLQVRGVKLGAMEGPRVRAVTHRTIDAEDVDWALGTIRKVMQGFAGRVSGQ
ncbi:MAG: threonine aldolase, partial [Dehalococcoidia bacterium]|nr:threonine aldolase [Dehalococcoidia bacterium]